MCVFSVHDDDMAINDAQILWTKLTQIRYMVQ